MNKTIFFLVSSLAFAACDDNTTNPTTQDLSTTGGGGDMAKGDMAMGGPDLMPPAPPTLGAQIDRMGRATINVAVTNPFNLAEPNGMRDATRDAYNQDGNSAMWVTKWSPQLQINLAVYDGADTKCGNQALACGMLTGCPNGYT